MLHNYLIMYRRESMHVFLPLSIQIDTIDLYRLGRVCTWYKSAEYGTSEIEPPRPLPSIGLSHLPVRKKKNYVFASALISMAKVEPNLGWRVKFGGLPTLGIRRRVSSPFLPFVMCTRRRRIPSVSKRTHDIPTMKHP